MLTLKYCCQHPAPVITVLFEMFDVVAIEIVMVFAPVLIEVISAVAGIPVALGLIPTT